MARRVTRATVMATLAPSRRSMATMGLCALLVAGCGNPSTEIRVRDVRDVALASEVNGEQVLLSPRGPPQYVDVPGVVVDDSRADAASRLSAIRDYDGRIEWQCDDCSDLPRFDETWTLTVPRKASDAVDWRDGILRLHGSYSYSVRTGIGRGRRSHVVWRTSFDLLTPSSNVVEARDKLVVDRRSAILPLVVGTILAGTGIGFLVASSPTAHTRPVFDAVGASLTGISCMFLGIGTVILLAPSHDRPIMAPR
jgi:hypothetical protein